MERESNPVEMPQEGMDIKVNPDGTTEVRKGKGPLREPNEDWREQK